MAATPFKVVSWSPDELLSQDKLDAMTNNDNWLRDNMARGKYTGHGVSRDEGVKIASGLKSMSARAKGSASATIRFDGFFLSACKPIITTGLVSSRQRAVWVTHNGIGVNHPDNRGFQVHVQVYADKKQGRRIKPGMFVSWHAVGY